ncbi:uncharacterized protein LOC119101469 isoform X2 [Pollicipes pollicipes]|uniref:uncharacterized protein LOC119101225 n=1 Tax=Pollicipes pollicipes TaxID=41117 RepID=UPI001884A0A9|nr:uncharacterized protein LOC119101225 [Pollicipes pollicipes]XP_037080460.1 uncharacterized protein LOC119101264 [Pollicipes pollicipes]XP_037080706.1 uncharacterized protein LOC119101469 isoform X2 [Pollicipes pollicipes]
MAAHVILCAALLASALASPLPQEDVVEAVPLEAEFDEAQLGSVIIRPPRVEKVTHVTSNHQYQKLYPKNGKYKFGFDDDNQFRVEERLGNGHLRGIYGYKNEDGSITAFMYTYDGERYKQVPYTVEDIPDDLRIAPEAQGPPRFVRGNPEIIDAE